jgi:DNA-binding protein H-NS
MAVNIKAMSAGQLLTLRNDIDLRLQQMASELEKQLVQIKGLSAPTTRGRRTSSLKGMKAAAKYRNSANPKETWAGRGMKPRWLTAALKAGKKLESFAIKK